MAKRKLVPKPYAGGRWSQARFFGFIRSALRRTSTRWPPKCDASKAARRKYTGPNKRQKWEVRCSECGKWYKLKEVNVHHTGPCGTLKAFTDLPGFVERLFCEVDGFEVLCNDKCHKARHEKEKK